LIKAYEVLADEEKRRIYDRFGEEGLEQQGGGGGGHNPFDIFSQWVEAATNHFGSCGSDSPEPCSADFSAEAVDSDGRAHRNKRDPKSTWTWT
jgi:DnaJ-class molecular chaperone